MNENSSVYNLPQVSLLIINSAMLDLCDYSGNGYGAILQVKEESWNNYVFLLTCRNRIDNQLPTFYMLFVLNFRKVWASNSFILNIHLHIVPFGNQDLHKFDIY